MIGHPRRPVNRSIKTKLSIVLVRKVLLCVHLQMSANFFFANIEKYFRFVSAKPPMGSFNRFICLRQSAYVGGKVSVGSVGARFPASIRDVVQCPGGLACRLTWRTLSFFGTPTHGWRPKSCNPLARWDVGRSRRAVEVQNMTCRLGGDAVWQGRLDPTARPIPPPQRKRPRAGCYGAFCVCLWGSVRFRSTPRTGASAASSGRTSQRRRRTCKAPLASASPARTT